MSTALLVQTTLTRVSQGYTREGNKILAFIRVKFDNASRRRGAGARVPRLFSVRNVRWWKPRSFSIQFPMRRDTWNDAQKAWFGSDYPFTIGLMVLQFVALIIYVSSAELLSYLGLQVPIQMFQIWRYLTYSIVPAAGPGFGLFLSYLFTAGLTYWFCGSLERSWGTRTFALFYIVLSIISAIALIPGAFLFSTRLAGEVAPNLGIPIENRMPILACAVAWGILNAEEMITLFFIPMRGIFISLIAALVVAFDYAQMSLILVPFSLVGCAASYFWVKHERWSPSALSYGISYPTEKRPKLRLVPSGKAKQQRPLDDRFTWRDLNPFERIARKRREKKLQKLLGDD